jgi:sRNA-binding carbon storage regulator CsrA
VRRSKKKDGHYGLVLSRLEGECVVVKIGDIEGRVTLARGEHGRCRLAFDFPRSVEIYRQEVGARNNE